MPFSTSRQLRRRNTLYGSWHSRQKASQNTGTKRKWNYCIQGLHYVGGLGTSCTEILYPLHLLNRKSPCRGGREPSRILEADCQGTPLLLQVGGSSVGGQPRPIDELPSSSPSQARRVFSRTNSFRLVAVRTCREQLCLPGFSSIHNGCASHGSHRGPKGMPSHPDFVRGVAFYEGVYVIL